MPRTPDTAALASIASQLAGEAQPGQAARRMTRWSRDAMGAITLHLDLSAAGLGGVGNSGEMRLTQVDRETVAVTPSRSMTPEQVEMLMVRLRSVAGEAEAGALSTGSSRRRSAP